MIKLYCLLLIIFSTCVGATNYAIVAGGAAQNDDNEFLQNLSSAVDGLVSKNWETSVLFDSNYRPSEWEKFPKNVRPKIYGEKSHHFSYENLVKEIDNLLMKKVGPNDQVELFFAAHGGVIKDAHRIDWHDMRDKNILEQLGTSIIDKFTPTKDLIPKIKELLKRGVKLHFNSLSCFDGQIIKDFNELLKEFPNQLCITTSTMSDRPSLFNANDVFLSNLYNSNSKSSILDTFYKSQNSSMFISNLASYQNLIESISNVKEDEDKEKEQLPINYCLTSKLILKLPLSEEQLKFVVSNSSLPINKEEMNCNKYKTICSEDFNIKSQNSYVKEYKEIVKKNVPKIKWAILDYKEYPSLIKKDTSRGVSMYSISTSIYSANNAYGSPVINVSQIQLANLLMQDRNKFTNEEKKGIDQLIKKISLDSELYSSVVNLSQQLKSLNQKYDKIKCNKEQFDEIIIKLKKSLLDSQSNPSQNSACEKFII